MQEVLVNRLGGLSLPRKSVVRLTDRPIMTLDVYRGRKTTIQQQQQQPSFQETFTKFHSGTPTFLKKCHGTPVLKILVRTLVIKVTVLVTLSTARQRAIVALNATMALCLAVAIRLQWSRKS